MLIDGPMSVITVGHRLHAESARGAVILLTAFVKLFLALANPEILVLLTRVEPCMSDDSKEAALEASQYCGLIG